MISDAEVWPCIRCATMIINSGIEAVAFPEGAVEYEAQAYPDAYHVSDLFRQTGVMLYYYNKRTGKATLYIDFEK